MATTDVFSLNEESSKPLSEKADFAYDCLAFIQDKKVRGYDAKDILEELEDFLQNTAHN